MSSAINSERMPNVTAINIGTLAATTTLPGMYFRKHSRIKEVRLIDQAGIAADATNHYKVDLQDGASNSIAAIDSKDGALTANVSKALTLASPVGDTANQPEADVAAALDTKIVVTKNGTGVPTLAVLLIEWYPL